MASTANTFKFGTFLWLLAGLLIPLWPISLPICWIMAYLSYRSGTSLADQIVTAQSRMGGRTMRSATSLSSASSVESQSDMHRWEVLVELDPEIAKAAELVRARGPAFERALATKYLALNDKQYLEAAVAKVLEEADAAEDAARAEANIPSTGLVGPVSYKRSSEGLYIITKGKHVGKNFGTFAELKDFVGRNG